MTITAIVEHPRKPGRYVVDVDGREAALVSAEWVAELGLRIGAEMSGAQLDALRAADTEVALYDRALNLLSHRARSARELRRRLREKLDADNPDALIDATIAKLERLGLVDDAEFARQVARSKVVGQGASKRRVKQELFKRGVSGALVDDAIERVYADESIEPRELAERAARKRLKSLGSADAETRRRRLYGFLARRGYESDEIRAALEVVLGEIDGEVSED